VSAMAIMVHSFRTSVDHWLGHVLAADVYLRAPGGLQAQLPDGLADRLCKQPGLARCERLRYHSLLLDPAQPPVTLIARTMDEHTFEALALPRVPAGAQGPLPAVWVSEAMVALHAAPAQGEYSLPLGNRTVKVHVAGVWRDYSRTWGALVMARDDYQKLTGDAAVNDLAFNLADTQAAASFARQLRADHEASRQEIAERADIRRFSLALFDRTFAVTYALELAALLVGLVGIAAHFAALTVTRRREFGMLRHLGFTRTQLARMLMLEGAVTGAAGALVGLVLGFAISLVLIHVVNRQSFHWGMELALPWLPLLLLALLLVALAALGARLAGRAAMQNQAVLAVKGEA
jgi:putative ABC transport system permease protein